MSLVCCFGCGTNSELTELASSSASEIADDSDQSRQLPAVRHSRKTIDIDLNETELRSLKRKVIDIDLNDIDLGEDLRLFGSGSSVDAGSYDTERRTLSTSGYTSDGGNDIEPSKTLGLSMDYDGKKKTTRLSDLIEESVVFVGREQNPSLSLVPEQFCSEGSRYSASSTTSLMHTQEIKSSLQRAKLQARLRSLRLRVPTVLGGSFSVLAAIILSTISGPYSVGDVASSWLAGVGVFIAFLGFLPSDRIALPVAIACLIIPMAFGFVGSAIFQLHDISKGIGEEKCVCLHEDVPCWYVFLIVAVGSCDSLACLAMIARLTLALARRTRSAVLLSILWSTNGWFLVLIAATALTRSILGFAVGHLELAVPSFFSSVALSISGRLHLYGSRFRSTVQSWFLSRGEAVVTAAGVAELLGDRSINEVIASARKNFSYIRGDHITKEAMADNQLNTELGALTQKTRLGNVDAFFSHSWHDNPEAKWKALQDYRKDFKLAYAREPRLWIDKYCIDQTNIDDSLACLPVYLSGCKELVIACGGTYLERLWCLIEIFVFLEMGGDYADLDVRLLDEVMDNYDVPLDWSTESSGHLQDFLKQFNPRNARCSSDYDTERLHAVIQATGYDRIIQLVEDVFVKSQRRCQKMN